MAVVARGTTGGAIIESWQDIPYTLMTSWPRKMQNLIELGLITESHRLMLASHTEQFITVNCPIVENSRSVRQFFGLQLNCSIQLSEQKVSGWTVDTVSRSHLIRAVLAVDFLYFDSLSLYFYHSKIFLKNKSIAILFRDMQHPPFKFQFNEWVINWLDVAQ